MYARIEGCIEKNQITDLDGLDSFEFPLDLEKYQGEQLEIRFKKDQTVEVAGGGLCLTFPNNRVKIIYE